MVNGSVATVMPAPQPDFLRIPGEGDRDSGGEREKHSGVKANKIPGFFRVQIKVAKKRSHPTALPDGAAARSRLTNRDQAGGLPLGTD